MKHLIYGLCDPRDLEVRYVGYTSKSVESRLVEHLEESRKRVTSHKHKWIAKMLRDDVKPKAIILEEVDANNWQERERFWIQYYGAILVNSTGGGEGLVNPSQDVRNRIGETVRASGLHIGNQHRKGIPHTEESKQAIKDGLKKSEKFIEAMKRKKGIAPTHAILASSLANKGKPKSEDTRKKMSLARMGNKIWLGKKHSEETKEKIRLANLGNTRCLGNKHTPDACAKISASKVGKKFIHNGLVTKLLEPDQPLPSGWNFGMLKTARK